jgi:hypothetical protein
MTPWSSPMNNTTVTIAGQTLTAAVCPHGCRVYPPEHLPAHLERHESAYQREVGQYWVSKGERPKHKAGYRKPGKDRKFKITISGRNHRNVRPDEVAGYLSALEQHVGANPGRSLAQVVRELPNPFWGDNSARDCISRSIKSGRIGIELRKNGRFTELWAR